MHLGVQVLGPREQPDSRRLRMGWKECSSVQPVQTLETKKYLDKGCSASSPLRLFQSVLDNVMGVRGSLQT